VSVVVRAVVRRSCYRDSLVLMRVAERLRERPGVREAAALMGTPANRAMLADAGLSTPEAGGAEPGDLILAVAADTDAVAEAALAAGQAILDAERRAPGPGERVAPRTLDAALRQMPGANLAAVSVPGPYARLVAQQALNRGLHVFLFSDNVPVEDEVALKRLALSRRLLCMGPDCGTAYLNGLGLGFANVVSRGRVGCVAASGTGLQAVVSRLAALGEGISHGIGVGGRDLSEPVCGAMTLFAIEALAAGPSTELIVLIGKPPAAGILPRVERALAAAGKPVIGCCLGAMPAGNGHVRWVDTLDAAAEAAAATLAGRAFEPRGFGDATAARERLARLGDGPARQGPALWGLYTGGTLAAEARLVLEPLLGPVATTLRGGSQTGHRVVDLGDDEFTVGRPHPMLDPEARAVRVREAGRAPEVGVLLLDLVLGRGVHPDPAGPLAAAVEDARRAARADGRRLAAVASVVGTERDPQGFRGQVARLEAAGVAVLPGSAQAARFAAAALRPDLAPAVLGSAG